MNIRQIAGLLSTARAEQNPITRGRNMLQVQRLAAQSRSRNAYAIESWAHLGAVCALDRATNHHDRSELGQVRAESQHRFTVGGTASRSVAPTL